MHRPSVAHRVGVLAVSALIATAMSLQLPPPARAGGGGGGESTAQSSGDAGCMTWIQGAPCQDWSTTKPEGSHDWIYVDEATYGGGGSLITRQSFDGHEEYTIAGSWRSTTLTGSMTASNSGGGKAGNDLSYDLAIETPGPQVSVTGTISAVAEGSEYVLGIAAATIVIECGGVEFEFDREIDAGNGYAMSDSGSFTPSASVDSEGNSCDIEFDAGVGATTNQKAPGNAGSVRLEFNLTFSTDVIEGCEGIEGTVSDGQLGDLQHPLGGVRVQLHRNGSPVGTPVMTADDGFYCVPAEEAVPPGDYQLRATLIDQRHEPPLFETRHAADTAAVFVEVPVTADSFAGAEQVLIHFVDAARPWVSNVATIHYESDRFVRWLTETLGWSPAAIGPFVIVTYDADGTRYSRGLKTVYISEADSALVQRDQASDLTPENGEWHEIAHHVGAVLGVGATTAAACQGRIGHAGWLNTSTCDSIVEGFAMFMATLGSQAVDAGREASGYATTNYAGMVDLESQEMFPWSAQQSAGGGWLQREDMAVAELLWDLSDDTPTETSPINLAGPEGEQRTLRDEIAVGGSELVDVMATFQVNTVDDLYRALVGSELLAGAASTPSIDLDDDGDADISSLDAVFLLHGFHPVEEPIEPAFRLGDAFPRTDHVPDGPDAFVPRFHIEQVPGSFIRLQNGTDEPVTFSVEVAAAGDQAPYRVSAAVAGHATDLMYLEVAPYYRAVLGPGDALPGCEVAELTTRQISITAPGMEPVTLDTCAYQHAVVASTDGAALTVTVGTGPVGASAAPVASGGGPPAAQPISAAGPSLQVLLGAGSLVLAGAAVIGWLALRRRGARRVPGA